LAGTDPEWDTTNTKYDSEMTAEGKECTLYRMAKVHHFLEIWQGSQNLHATQKESRAQNEQMTTIRLITDPEEIVKASRSLFHHDGVAASQMSERSPWPPALFAKDLRGGRSEIVYVNRIWRIHCHPVEIDEDSAPESVSDTNIFLNWNRNWDTPIASEADCAADDKSNI
jgi:hypothetical protein